MIRFLLAVALLASVAGCGVPAPIVWSAVGAGLGYVASVNNLADSILKRQAAEDRPAPTD